ncbi:ATP-binding protein [Pseudonocardia eucalypti]|uniref:ATP-binding protein n=1 Tax=Pseudonocardia eucalypti TaxID=648755 RepID=UPI0016153FC5
MSFDSESVEYVHRTWPADARELAVIRHAVRGWLETLSLDSEETADLVLAVDEAASNAIEHAYRPGERDVVELLLWTEPGVLYVEVVDHGRWKRPSSAASFRGRGIQVMRSITDSVLIHYDERGTRVLLCRALPFRRPKPAN